MPLPEGVHWPISEVHSYTEQRIKNLADDTGGASFKEIGKNGSIKTPFIATGRDDEHQERQEAKAERRMESGLGGTSNRKTEDDDGNIRVEDE